MRWFYSYEDLDEDDIYSFCLSLEHSGHSEEVYCTSYIIFDEVNKFCVRIYYKDEKLS